MTTTRVLATALPVSLAADADRHLVAFITLKLVPDAPGSTLGDFPAAADWVTTSNAGRWELVTDAVADALALVVVPDPVAPAEATAWTAVLPSDTPVAGYPTPAVSAATWNSMPAHRLSDHAIDLHLATITAAPTGRPGVLTNPAVSGILDRLAQAGGAIPELRQLAEDRRGRAEAILARRTRDAQVNLGIGGRQRVPYDTEVRPSRSAIEALLDDDGADERITAMLDAGLGAAPAQDPQRQLMYDAHAARRYYDRPEEQTPYQPEPTPGASTPRPDRPIPDAHERMASFGNTPVLLRRLGLAVGLRLADPDQAALLVNATWVAVRFVPGPDQDVVRFAPPRTRVVVAGDRFEALASADWVNGALPLGEDGYVLLDLDPDASGLKLDQHVRGLPRAAAAEVNGDAVTSAPGTLRTCGFAVARTDRVAATRARTARAEAMNAADDAPGVAGPEVFYDDLVRGLRLEVWDSRTRAWHSLHERIVTVTAQLPDGAGVRPVLTDVADSGFVQTTGLNRVPGSPANPYYLHEVIAGWDGWSLSAPRPGKVIVHGAGGEESVLDAPPDEPATGVHIATRVQPGSLPRLRWGTSYAFRLLGVDLAGGVVPRSADPDPAAPVAPEAIHAAGQQLERLRQSYARRDAGGFLHAVRDVVLAGLPQAGPPVDWFREQVSPGLQPPGAGAVELPDFVRTGDEQVDGLIADRIAEGTASQLAAIGEPAAAQEFQRVAQATRVLAEAAPAWRVRPQLAADPNDLARALGVAPRPIATAPRPYLRWAPVPPPTLVARRALTTGEQLSRLVVRSGLAGDDPDATTVCERHVVPAKTTQLDAETAGRFDAAIGSTQRAVHDAAYPVALAERGTLLDQQIPRLDDATATRAQPGIALLARPGADPGAAVGLADITLRRDTPLGEGQYVVHDVNDLVLPYLPDPHAAGIALVFYDAGAPHLMAEPRALQAVVLPFPGDWPRVEPLRLVLERGATLGARLDGRAVRVSLPAGEQVRVALSSSLRPTDLDVFGLWRSHLASTIDPDGDGGATPEQVVAAAALLRAAASGWTWWLTPSVDVRLVHAVPAPARVPQLLHLTCQVRPPGLTVAQLAGIADVHGASTDRLVVRAAWSEWVDDVATPGPQRVERTEVVVNSPVGGTQRWGLLWLVDFQPFGGSAAVAALADGDIGLHKALATFPDTHRRSLVCTPSGVTRYAEFFSPADVPAPDDPSLAGTPVVVEVPSSARPAAAEVIDTVPLIRWETQTEPEQPFALRRVRRSGVRIWLRRPWYSSGDGELLGVMLSGDADEPADSVSLWGRDPIYFGPTLTTGAAPPLVEPAHLLLGGVAEQVVPRTARPLVPAARLPLVDVVGTPTVSVLGYLPEYHPERGQWFVDIALDDGPVLWPFVRLAVARYQPSSVDSCHLSAVGLTSWVQPLPTRTCTVSRPDGDHVRVTVTGTVAFLRTRDEHDQQPPGAELDADTPTGSLAQVDAALARTRTMDASIQVLPEGATDLQWRTVVTRRLHLVGVGDETNFRATWSGELALPAERPFPVELATPGGSTRWRVLVEENELLDADAPGVPNQQAQTVLLARVVYADTIPL